MKFELNAKTRVVQGSGASRRLRTAKKVPGIVYGGEAAPALVELDHNDLLLALRKEAFHSSVLTLNIDGKAQSVLLRDSQMHPYKPLVLHVDFLRVDSTHVIHQKVPLHFINGDLAPGVKVAGSVVSPAMNEVDVSCLPQDLPAFIEVDLKDLNAGQTIHVSQLVFPAGVKAHQHGSDDPVVVSIPVKKTEVPEVAEGEAAAPAAAPAAAATPPAA
jgi:large subunit ribosomal protein L25